MPVPAVPIDGVNSVIVGAPTKLPTVKVLLLVAKPAGAVIVMGPVVAPAGTVTITFVPVANLRGSQTIECYHVLTGRRAEACSANADVCSRWATRRWKVDNRNKA